MSEISDSPTRQENGIKMTQIGKEEVKIMLLLYDMILGLNINTFIEASKYNDNQHNQYFLYTNNYYTEKDMRKAYTFKKSVKKKLN